MKERQLCRKRSTNCIAAQTTSNTEHPAFIYEARATTEVRLDFHALGDEFFIERCEITPTQT